MAFAVIPALPFGTTVNAIFPEKIFRLVKYLDSSCEHSLSFLSLRTHGFSGRKDGRCCKVEWER